VNRRWWLVPIAIPAGVAVWSGWVGLGGLCGFGPVDLLPGIGGSFGTINTAITLPVGVEAYGAFALGAWITAAEGNAKTFARWSALGALAYGMLGQVTYHLLVSRGYAEAPWPVVVVVSCMPVAVLGFAAALAHLLGADERGRGEAQEDDGSGTSPATIPSTVSSSPAEAAKARMRLAMAHGFKYSDNEAAAEWRLTRGEVTKARREVTAESPAGLPPVPAGASGRDVSPRVPAALNGNGHAHG